MNQDPTGDAWAQAEAGGHEAARPGDFGNMLHSARVARGLELADIAELTHVRKEYLKALEEGRFGDLPEDVYTRNFVRLFAQAVGISPETAIAAYSSERRRAGGLTTMEQRLEKERRGEPPPAPKRRSSSSRGGLPRIGPALPTLLLVVGLVALAVWGFNRLLFNPNRPGGSVLNAPLVNTPSPGLTPTSSAGQTSPEAAPAAAEPAATAALDDGPRTILITVTSNPPGAVVSVDSFVLRGVTPILDAPVTARARRVLSVRLDGYQPFDQTVDLLDSQSLHVDLTPVPAVAGVTPVEPVAGAASSNQLSISVRASTWLEVYRSTQRNVGDRLVYRTAEPGESFVFDLPVYVHVGNAAGVEVSVGETVIGSLGSSGAVVGQAFTAP